MQYSFVLKTYRKANAKSTISRETIRCGIVAVRSKKVSCEVGCKSPEEVRKENNVFCMNIRKTMALNAMSLDSGLR
jgi:hypothetical protein